MKKNILGKHVFNGISLIGLISDTHIPEAAADVRNLCNHWHARFYSHALALGHVWIDQQCLADEQLLRSRCRGDLMDWDMHGQRLVLEAEDLIRLHIQNLTDGDLAG